ncbi:MAG: hypothetical protein OEV42_15445 [Deltaproteobacteria bacterium]|nr:hypothetical protein [Deltaproteobacteria bacterium]
MGKEREKHIWIEDGIINYQVGDKSKWSVPLANLEVVGEFTNPNGPLVDDYFLVFVTRPEHHWNAASFYASERDEFLTCLGEILGNKLTCSLANSTVYNSRVMWPSEIEGKQLFNLVPTEAKGFWKKIKHRLIPNCDLILAAEIRDFLK